MSSVSKDKYVNTVVLTDFGGFDKIQVRYSELESVSCGKDDVEVSVNHCGVNFADLYLRQGLIPSISTPCTLGLECAGIVQNVGCDVTKFKKGQRVLCYRGDGGLYRETVIVNEKYCFLIPDDIPLRTAVALPANYLTAYFCLFEFGNLRPGQTVLIHSCGGGVGWAATQLAKTVSNVTVVGTASSFKHETVKSNGVDYVVQSTHYLEELNADEKLSNMKFDIIIDSIGGYNVEISQELLNTFGKVVVIGVSHIMVGEERLSSYQLMKLWWQTKHIAIANLVRRSYMVAGFHLTYVMEENSEKVAEVMGKIFDLCLAEKIKPRIDSQFSFNQAVEAMQRLAHRKNIGKVVLNL